MRGKPFGEPIYVKILRITPAGAGKTRTAHTLTFARRDHPRRCGENFETAVDCFLLLGSPPQVRGKPVQCSALARVIGITPAGAGKTVLPLFSDFLHWDHPRRCGENTKTE